MNDINILITSCGRRVELVKAFQNARDIVGIKGSVMCADMSVKAPAMMFADKSFTVPRLSDHKYIDELINICTENNIDLIVPTIDTELQILADYKSKIENCTNAKVLISNSNVIEICNDKIKATQFFADNGFSIPNTLSDSDVVNGNYSFPLFIKPLNGSSSINAFKVNNEKELKFFYDYITDPIVQECVTGVEYTVDVFIDFDGNIITCVPRKRLATRGGEVLIGEIDMNCDIIDNVTKMIKTLGAIGHITVQGFYCEDKQFRYIEINPRYGGGAPMSIKAGADSCSMLYKLLSGSNITDEDTVIRDGALFSRFDDCVEIV